MNLLFLVLAVEYRLKAASLEPVQECNVLLYRSYVSLALTYARAYETGEVPVLAPVSAYVPSVSISSRR